MFKFPHPFFRHHLPGPFLHLVCFPSETWPSSGAGFPCCPHPSHPSVDAFLGLGAGASLCAPPSPVLPATLAPQSLGGVSPAWPAQTGPSSWAAAGRPLQQHHVVRVSNLKSCFSPKSNLSWFQVIFFLSTEDVLCVAEMGISILPALLCFTGGGGVLL